MQPHDAFHPLNLYRHAVQHPRAEVRMLQRIYTHHRDTEALLLREDFAGGAALSAAWVAQSEDHQAMAVELDTPTAAWAEQNAHQELAARAPDLHIVNADVMQVTRPRVDVTCALNFSVLELHHEQALQKYLRHVRRGLRPGGLFIMDLYGGPGAMRPNRQSRTVTPPDDQGLPAFRYTWEQRSFDALTHRTHCRIHFDLPDGRRLDTAFDYHWRLWTLPELSAAARRAGFREPTVWCDSFDPATNESDGIYEPKREIPAREDWIAYLAFTR